MPALPADIVRATRQARVLRRVDTDIQTRFANARDMIEQPQPGFFEEAADGSSALDLAAALTGTFRRRFLVALADELEVDPMVAVPTFHLNDADSDADLDVLLCRIEIDDETETTVLEVLG